MQQVYNDISYPGQKPIQALLTRLLTQRILQYPSEQIGDWAQIVGIDADGVEGATCYVELVAQADVDVADFRLGGLVARPLGEGFEELFGGDEEVGDGFLDGAELLLRLERRMLVVDT